MVSLLSGKILARPFEDMAENEADTSFWDDNLTNSDEYPEIEDEIFKRESEEALGQDPQGGDSSTEKMDKSDDGEYLENTST